MAQRIGWILLLLGGAAAAQGFHDDQESVPIMSDCGAYCLGVALSLAGRPVPDFMDLRVQAQTDANGVTSMKHLAEALRYNGVETSSRRTPEVLDAPFCIALVQKPEAPQEAGHFVVLEWLSDDVVIQYVPPFWVRRTRWSDLRGRIAPWILAPETGSGVSMGLWLVGLCALASAVVGAGLVLLRWRSCAPATAVALLVLLAACGDRGRSTGAHLTGRIQFLPSRVVDLGLQSPGLHATVLLVQNNSEKAVAVRRVTSTCECTSLVFDKSRPLMPGEKRRLKATLRLDENTRRTVMIAVYLADGGGATAYILGQAGREERIRYPRTIDLGRVPGGSPTGFRFSLVDTSGSVRRIAWSADSLGEFRTTASAAGMRGGHATAWTDFELAPREVGPGRRVIEGRAGTIALRCAVLWDAVLPFRVDPPIVVLKAANGFRVGRCSVEVPAGGRVEADGGKDFSVSVGRMENRCVIEVRAREGWPGVNPGWIRISVGAEQSTTRFPVQIVAGLSEE